MSSEFYIVTSVMAGFLVVLFVAKYLTLKKKHSKKPVEPMPIKLEVTVGPSSVSYTNVASGGIDWESSGSCARTQLFSADAARRIIAGQGSWSVLPAAHRAFAVSLLESWDAEIGSINSPQDLLKHNDVHVRISFYD